MFTLRPASFYMQTKILMYNKEHICIMLSSGKRWKKEEMFYLTMHSTHYIYGYMASDIW